MPWAVGPLRPIFELRLPFFFLFLTPSTSRDSILRSNAFLGPFEISTPVRPLGVRRSYSAALRSDPEWAPVWGWMFAS